MPANAVASEQAIAIMPTQSGVGKCTPPASSDAGASAAAGRCGALRATSAKQHGTTQPVHRPTNAKPNRLEPESSDHATTANQPAVSANHLMMMRQLPKR